MKKITAIVFSAILSLTLMACGGNTQTEKSASSQTAGGSKADSAQVTDSSKAASGSESSNSGAGTLVVYYSATGNTKAVAGMIAKDAGADLFELVPEKPYTDDDLNWSDDSSRVSKEHEDESLRDVPLKETAPAHWDQYDTVLIGYPIWWGIAAWPVNNFIKANDFSNKTVIPFCTSASSGIGQSGELLAEMAGTGDWQDGMRFSGSASEEDVSSWVESLGLNSSDQ